jgi:cytochrome P450 family 110
MAILESKRIAPPYDASEPAPPVAPPLPPGPKAFPLWQGLRLRRRPAEFIENCTRRFGDVFTCRFGIGPPTVFFSEPGAVKDILTGDPEVLCGGRATAFFSFFLGENSLLMLDGARHARERRLLLPPFHGDRLRFYCHITREVTERAAAGWPLGQPFSVYRALEQITLDVILQAVLGLEGPQIPPARDRVIPYTSYTSGLGMVLLIEPRLRVDLGRLSPWGRFLRVRREVDRLLLAEISRRRAQGTAGRNDVLSVLMEARYEDGEGITDEDLRDKMITLLFAGHETTSTALAWAVHRILQRPDVLEKIRAELRTVAGDGPIEWQHLARFEYLDAVIKEILRHHPPVHMIGRVLRNPTRIGGWMLPAGVIAAVSIYATHRRPDLWPEPEHFRPEHFIGRRPGPYEFLPFGGGHRHCIGAEFASLQMKVILATVFNRFELRAAARRVVRPTYRMVTVAPPDGVPVIAERRSTTG